MSTSANVEFRTPEPIFYHEEREDGIYHSEILPMTLAERRRRSQIVPTILKNRRHLTSAELLAADYVQMSDKPHYMEIKVSRRNVTIPYARYFSPTRMQGIGVVEELAEIQRICFSQDFQPKLASISKAHCSGHEKLRGTTYDLGVTVQPGHGNNGVQLGGLAKANDEEIKRVSTLVSQVASRMIKSAFSTPSMDVLERRWVVDAALTIGSEENHQVSSIQVNFSMLDQELVDAIKEVGKVHNDGKDDRARFTALLFLPYFPKDHFPGRFLITTSRLTCTAAPFSGLVFSGTHAHFATAMGKYEADIGLGSPFRYTPPAGFIYPPLPTGTRYGRVAIVAYPKRFLMRLSPSAMRPAHLETDAALAHHGTWRNMQEFRLRVYVKRHHKFLHATHTSARTLINDFSWLNEGGEREFPDLQLAVDALEWAGEEDWEWEELNAAVEKIGCGSKFPNVKGQTKKASTKCGEEEWIEVDAPAMDESDGIPGASI
ncbi:uncharacterized protein RSE6_04480 [Rhynchosporium secalis]|uniref:Uncharacterized protein n=1 Tax=Rhynchosporium secalis TaxID=38038 RepID=A0A1E1M5E1_RHYSE|nr:uncharacterized protein RSE6_04480 [Rhynchosporium secalis]